MSQSLGRSWCAASSRQGFLPDGQPAALAKHTPEANGDVGSSFTEVFTGLSLLCFQAISVTQFFANFFVEQAPATGEMDGFVSIVRFWASRAWYVNCQGAFRARDIDMRAPVSRSCSPVINPATRDNMCICHYVSFCVMVYLCHISKLKNLGQPCLALCSSRQGRTEGISNPWLMRPGANKNGGTRRRLEIDLKHTCYLWLVLETDWSWLNHL